MKVLLACGSGRDEPVAMRWLSPVCSRSTAVFLEGEQILHLGEFKDDDLLTGFITFSTKCA